MKKIFLIVPFVLSLMIFAPSVCRADVAVEVIDNDIQDITVSVSSSILHVTGASGQTLYIYNVAGVRVMTIKVEGNDRHYDLNLPQGCYIVKVGKTVRKISIK